MKRAPGIRQTRLVSLDALRGFDMSMLIGARVIAAGLAKLDLPGVSAIVRQLSHTPWNGLTFYDVIFPLFVFITGVSLTLSLRKRLERGDERRAIMRHVTARAVMLFLLGIVYNEGFGQAPLLVNIRVMGVLQRIALCYFFAAMLVLYTKPRTQVAVAASILVGYWAVMKFVPVPGHGAGVWTVQGNLAGYLDRRLLPGRLFYGDWDPEGLLTTVPAVATCLLGVLSGHWLRSSEKVGSRTLTAEQRAKYLFLGGLVTSVVGLLVSPAFPLNKNLWTSSFVLVTGGLGIMALAALHWVIDLQGHRRWAFPLVAIGMNSMFIYLAVRFVPFGRVAEWLVGGGLSTALGPWQALFQALVQLTLELSLLVWLYRRKILIKI